MSTVYVIDDNADVLQQIGLVLERAGHHVLRFLCPIEFLTIVQLAAPAAIVVDVRMPGMSGLELQAALKAKSVRTPIVFISGESQPKEIIAALKAQAVDFLLKPFSVDDLRAAVALALDHDRRRIKQEDSMRSVQAKRELLSSRERDAFHLIIRGYSNKEVGAELDVKPDTAKKYRAAILSKFNVSSLSELLAFIETRA